ncbi:MAG: alcohol dehydrogenase catalytic domain-containing protein [Planctomycetales bacterium]|nr:alcohol dehydrogenase catalytic domain-containing protein [Planctomycetales bacterium]
MNSRQFTCLLVEQDGSKTKSSIATLPSERLPPGNVTIRVSYSSLNYKDALAYQGHPGIAKHLPHVPGIDAVGTVLESQSEKFKTGDSVIVTGYDLGQGTWGGWSIP